MQFTLFAPLANMDNYDANEQIYDTAKYLEIYCFFSLGKIRVNCMQKCSFGILEKQEQTPLQISGFAILLPAFEVQ